MKVGRQLSDTYTIEAVYYANHYVLENMHDSDAILWAQTSRLKVSSVGQG